MPADLFVATRGLTLEGNWLIFSVITGVTGVALYLSYLNATTQRKAM